MRDEHNESKFPCEIPGCERVGRKGYSRQKDLKKHREDMHPDSGPYLVARQSTLIQCQPCGMVFASYQTLAEHQSSLWYPSGNPKNRVCKGFYDDHATN
jgi:hypothetical protein